MLYLGGVKLWSCGRSGCAGDRSRVSACPRWTAVADGRGKLHLPAWSVRVLARPTPELRQDRRGYWRTEASSCAWARCTSMLSISSSPVPTRAACRPPRTRRRWHRPGLRRGEGPGAGQAEALVLLGRPV